MIKEEIFKIILEGLHQEAKGRLKELENKMGVGYFHHFISSYLGPNFQIESRRDTDGIASNILKKTGRTELVKVCSDLIGILMANLKHVPEHTESVAQEVIEDFHHHYPGDRGYDYVPATVPAHFEISRKGMSQIDDYVMKLRETYDRPVQKRLVNLTV